MIQGDDIPKWLSYNNHNIKCFTEREIEGITSNYEAIIGKGGFGEVYKGVLEDGSTVAVKRFVHNVEEDFAKELKVHSEINHKNVVRLIGYCAEENALTIVTEYISKGNLSDVLHHDCIPIMLDTRLRIAVECSEALCYMHSQMYTQVIHGDIKPANILLDENLNAKLSDFGISRLVNTDATLFTDHIMGSRGYMDPLFACYGRLTSKSDVYSFGIVLLELITKKKVTVRIGETSIVECFTQTRATGIRRVRELFDVEISSKNNMKVLEGVAKLAGECLRMEMDRRPEMTDVAERLRALRKTQDQGKQTLTVFPRGWRNKPTTQDLEQCALNCKKKGILDLIVDPYLGGKIAPWCFDKFVETAAKCLADHRSDRPSRREVLQNLEMCLAEESGSLGHETLDDVGTSRPSTEERRRNLEVYLSDECGGDDDGTNRPS